MYLRSFASTLEDASRELLDTHAGFHARYLPMTGDISRKQNDKKRGVVVYCEIFGTERPGFDSLCDSPGPETRRERKTDPSAGGRDMK